MAGVNKVILVGNLGADPEARSLNNGGEVVNIACRHLGAVEGSRRQPPGADRVAQCRDLQRESGRVAKSYLRKGSKVYLEGQIQTRKWTGPVGQRPLHDRDRASEVPR